MVRGAIFALRSFLFAPVAVIFALNSGIFFAAAFALRWLTHGVLRCWERARGGRPRAAGSTLMGAGDAIWMQDTADNLMIINAVIVSDRVSVAAARAAVVKAWLAPDSPFVRLRGRPVRTVDGWAFVPAPAFDPAQQVFALPEDVATTARLQDYVGRTLATPLPTDRPAWQFQVAETFENGGSATVFRIHHAYGDGVALVRMLIERLCDCETGAVSYMAAASGAGEQSKWRGMLTAALHAPFVLAEQVLARPDRNPLHGQRVSGVRAVAWGDVAPLEAVKEVRSALHVTVNDVLVGVVAGAVRRVMRQELAERAGSDIPVAVLPHVRICSPVSTRSLRAPIVLNNEVAVVMPVIPAGAANSDPVSAIETVRRTAARFDAMKTSGEALVCALWARLGTACLPEAIARAVFNWLCSRCTLVLSNVPGPTAAITVAGARVRDVVFWVPQRANIGLGIGLFSYNGRVCGGISADAAILREPARMLEAMREEFEALRAEVRTKRA